MGSLMSGLRATSQILQRELNKLTVSPARMMSGVGETSTPGQGAGQGGGAGGSIREAGGSMGNGRQLKRSNSFGMNNKDRSKSTRTKKQPRIRRPKSEIRSFLFRTHIFVPLLIDVPTVKYI